MARPGLSDGADVLRTEMKVTPGTAASGIAKPQRRVLSTAELAWIALLPCALVAVTAIVLLGPPLGRALFPPAPHPLWPAGWWETLGSPEPVKYGRYVLAVLAPLLLIGTLLATSRTTVALGARTARALVIASQAMVTALVVVALVAQDPHVTPDMAVPDLVGSAKIAIAAGFVLLALLVLHNRARAARIAARVHETSARRWAALALAVAFTAIWLLSVVYTEELAVRAVSLNLPWTFDDAVAVLDGRTPLADYHVIYGKLFPYLAAIPLAAFGTTTLVYTLTAAALTGLALLAVYAVLRRVTRSSLLALALYLPFVATSDLDPGWDPDRTGAGSPMTMSAMWPMRYGGAYLLLWLTARHVDGRWPRRPWALFFVGGLIAMNTLEFGLAALVATAAALLCARPPASVREALRLVVHIAAGTFAAAALVALLTLARAGELHLGQMTEWPRVFTSLGWFSMRLPTWDLHLALYATFVAAIGLATVRLIRREQDRLLTSLLAWSGAFGLLASGYVVARPDAFKLTGLLSAWSLALILLAIDCVRTLAARDWRRPSIPQLLVLFGLGLSFCSLSGFPLPQDQIDRLTRTLPAPPYLSAADAFVGEHVRPGERVTILLPMGHLIAHRLEIENVTPYPFMNAIITRAQMQTLVDLMKRERIRKAFMPVPGSFVMHEGDSAPQHFAVLRRQLGLVPTAIGSGMIELQRAPDR